MVSHNELKIKIVRQNINCIHATVNDSSATYVWLIFSDIRSAAVIDLNSEYLGRKKNKIGPYAQSHTYTHHTHTQTHTHTQSLTLTRTRTHTHTVTTYTLHTHTHTKTCTHTHAHTRTRTHTHTHTPDLEEVRNH